MSNREFDNRLPDKIKVKIQEMQDEIVRCRGTGMVTRSQAAKLDRALDVFVGDANAAMKMFDNLMGAKK